MSADNYQEKLNDLRDAIVNKKQIKIWVKDTPDTSGHLLDPYAILEDATMTDFIYGYNNQQNRILLTRVSVLTKLKVMNTPFIKPDKWSEDIDTKKFKISVS
jgi:hypothetical protein